MICNLGGRYYKEPDFESQVRNRMQTDRVPHDEFPYLAAIPYPEPEHMVGWLQEQHGADCTTHMRWKGWILFRQEADVVAFTLTYPITI
jgi:hypothetical protein